MHREIMYTGTLMEQLMGAVERAEVRAMLDLADGTVFAPDGVRDEQIFAVQSELAGVA
jgi:hypothetical protein